MIKIKKLALVAVCFLSMASYADDSRPSNKLNKPKRSYSDGLYDGGKAGLIAGGALWAGILGKWAYDSYWRKPIHVIIDNLKGTKKYIDTVLKRNNSERESRQLNKFLTTYLNDLSENIGNVEENLMPGAKKPKKTYSRVGYRLLQPKPQTKPQIKIKEKK